MSENSAIVDLNEALSYFHTQKIHFVSKNCPIIDNFRNKMVIVLSEKKENTLFGLEMAQFLLIFIEKITSFVHHIIYYCVKFNGDTI